MLIFFHKIFVLGLSIVILNYPIYAGERDYLKENYHPQFPSQRYQPQKRPLRYDERQHPAKKQKNQTGNDFVEDVKPTNQRTWHRTSSNIENREDFKSTIQNEEIKRYPEQKPRGKDKYAKQFSLILANKKASLLTDEPLQKITAEEEDREGSRKWVKGFSYQVLNEEKISIHNWHRESSQIIKNFRLKNETKLYLPVETNFAVARLTFVLEDNDQEEVKMASLFISGWPAKNNIERIEQFSSDLFNRKLGKELDSYKHYELAFITQAYSEGKMRSLCSRYYEPFQEKLSSIINEELYNKEERLIGKKRLKQHLSYIKNIQQLPILYFHSEQSIRARVEEKIQAYKRSRPNTPIHHVEVDICSYYDMCWGCGDIFTSACHINPNTKVVIRISGCTGYFDKPFVDNNYSLRDNCYKFKGFEEGKAYEITPSFKPYIAHAAIGDLS